MTSNQGTQALTEVIWGEPPVHGGNKYGPIAAELRQQPGRWAQVEDVAGRRTHRLINEARAAAFAPAGSFEATRREGKTYARYVGTSTAGASHHQLVAELLRAGGAMALDLGSDDPNAREWWHVIESALGTTSFSEVADDER